MLFILNNFAHDVRTYGWSVAWYNVRFLVGAGIFGALILEPHRIHVHDEECEHE